MTSIQNLNQNQGLMQLLREGTAQSRKQDATKQSEVLKMVADGNLTTQELAKLENDYGINAKDLADALDGKLDNNRQQFEDAVMTLHANIQGSEVLEPVEITFGEKLDDQGGLTQTGGPEKLNDASKLTANDKTFTLADFKSMKAEAQLELLMSADAQQLRPLLKSLTKAQREDIRKLAEKKVETIVEKYQMKQATITATHNATSEQGVASPNAVSFDQGSTTRQVMNRRAQLIINIIKGIEDEEPVKPVKEKEPAAKYLEEPVLAPKDKELEKTKEIEKPKEVELPIAKEDTLKDFSTEEFIRRMRDFKMHQDLNQLLKGMNPEQRVKLVAMLDACLDTKAGSKEKWFQAKFGLGAGELSDSAKDALKGGFVEQVAGLTPGLLDQLLHRPEISLEEKGQMLGYLVEKGTAPDLAFKVLQESQQAGQLGELLPKVLHEGHDATPFLMQLKPEQAGKLLAWAADSSGDLTQRLNHMSNQITGLPTEQAKKIVRAFGAEVKTSPTDLLKKLTPATVKILCAQLERGGIAKVDEALLTKLSTALVASNNLKISELINKPQLADFQAQQVRDILAATTDNKQYLANVEQLLAQADKLPHLFSNPADLAKVLDRLNGQEQDSRTRSALQSLLDKAKPADLGKVWDNLTTGSKTNPTLRACMFYRFVSEGKFEMSKLMLKGNGKDIPEMAAKEPNKANMLDYLSEKVTTFSAAGKLFGGNNDNTADAMLWILKDAPSGGKARTNLEQAFKKVNQMVLGHDAEVMRNFMEKVKANKDDLTGKLTLDMVRTMGAALDSGYEKTTHAPGSVVNDSLNFYLGGNRQTDHEKSVDAIKQIARLVDADGKAALVRELATGTTYDYAEGAITDIFSMAGNAGQIPAMVAQLNLTTVADELTDNLVFTSIDEAQISMIALDLGSASRTSTDTKTKDLLISKTNELIAGAPKYTAKILQSIRTSDPQMLSRLNLAAAGKNLSPADTADLLKKLDSMSHDEKFKSQKLVIIAKITELAQSQGNSDAFALAVVNALPDDTLKALPQDVRKQLHSALDAGWTSGEEYKAMGRLGI